MTIIFNCFSPKISRSKEIVFKFSGLSHLNCKSMLEPVALGQVNFSSACACKDSS